MTKSEELLVNVAIVVPPSLKITSPPSASRVISPPASNMIGLADIVNPVVPSCVSLASLSAPILSTALSDNKNTSSPNTASFTTLSPPSVCNDPSVVLVASVASSVLIIPDDVIAPDATVPASVTLAPLKVAAVVPDELLLITS